MNKLIWFLALLLAVYFFIRAWLGISGLIPVIVFTLALALTLDYFGIFKIFPFKLNRKFSMIVLVVLWAYTFWTAGWLTTLMGGFKIPGAVTPVSSISSVSSVTPSSCMSSVSDEIRGTAATIDLNAWDLESNTPYSSAVDFSTNCYIYKNGNAATDYVTTSADTSAATLSGYSVGDTIYMYCGGSTYYGEPVEGLCVQTQRFPVAINAHTIVAETDLSTTVFDDTGATALTAGDGGADYDMTLGAGGEDTIYAKLKVNVANKAYQFCGWGTFTFYNISSVTVLGDDAGGTYTKVASPLHMSNLDVATNATATSTVYGTYTFFKRSPLLLHEWDSVKTQINVKAHASNDPNGFGPTASTANGFALLAKDCAYARGDDGKMYLDIYSHDTSEADVGLGETEISPQGKTAGVTIEVD